MTYRQKELAGIALIAALMVATLVVGGIFAGVGPKLYLSLGAVWCGFAAVLITMRAVYLRRRSRHTPGLLCERCGHEFHEVDATMCADCGAPRDMSVRTARNQRPSR